MMISQNDASISTMSKQTKEFNVRILLECVHMLYASVGVLTIIPSLALHLVHACSMTFLGAMGLRPLKD